jgi:photosystem II stability/assembly factor-like uncharacterized protein
VSVSDEDLARARNISVEQVRLLRQSRGTTNETLEVLPDAVLRQSLQRLAYPDRPALREEFRFRQALGDGGTGAPPQHAVETAVTELYVAAVTDPPAQTAGVPTGPPAAAPPAPGEAGLAVAAWQWLGPGNIGGRIRGIVIHPGDPSRMWVASVGGGVWHTQDGGTTWATVDDFLGNLACACIAMHPADPLTIYAGTGEGFGNIDAIAGNGIFATSDGVTWAVLPATRVPDFTFVNRIAVAPSGVVLAATNSGLFRSADAARATWTRVLSGVIADVKFDPRVNGRAIAGAGTGPGQGGAAWFTTDGGLTWTAASHGSAWQGRVELAYAARNPDIVYASVQMTSGAIWRSEDGGASYRPRDTHTLRGGTPAEYLGTQGWYGNAIWAGDPTDENLVIAGGIDLWRSTDGGNTLAEISTWWAHPPSPHADQHAIVSHPSYNGTSNRAMFFGSDGGIWAAPDIHAVGREASPPHVGGWTGLDNSFGVTQFYAGAGNTGTGRLIGGAQDNGTLCFDPQQGPQKWTTIFGGDGGWCAADPADPDVFYGEYVFLAIHRNTDGGASPDENGDRYIDGQVFNHATGAWDWKPAPHRIPDAMPVPSGQRRKALFIAPFVLDPNQPERILAGGLSLWRTNDAKAPNTPTSGPSWQSIKNPIVTSGDTRGFEISALAVATGDSDTVWVGHANGDLFLTGNGTAGSPGWQPVRAASFPPQRYCTRITIDVTRSDVVYVAFGGYTRGNLWVTRDGGTTWSDLSATLPTAPVRAVTMHPRHAGFVYAGTEVGLFASEDSGTTWSPTNQGPTNCSVDDLFWMGETLVSVTHGRGMYRIDLSGV